MTALDQLIIIILLVAVIPGFILALDVIVHVIKSSRRRE